MMPYGKLRCVIEDREALYRRDGSQKGFACNGCGQLFATSEEIDLHIMLVNFGAERRTPPLPIEEPTINIEDTP